MSSKKRNIYQNPWHIPDTNNFFKELNFVLNENIDSLSVVQKHNYVSKGHLKQSRCLIDKNILDRLDKNYLSKKSREEGSIIITTYLQPDGSFDLNIEDYDSSIDSWTSLNKGDKHSNT